MNCPNSLGINFAVFRGQHKIWIFKELMTNFFQSGAARDPVYGYARDGAEDYHIRGRQNIDRIWQECAQFIDSDAVERAKGDIRQVFSELHMAYALCHAGKCLRPRAKLNYKNNEGPDLFAEGTTGVWIEVIAVKPGDGANELKSGDPEVVGTYNPDGLVLRLRSAISTKSEKVRKYLEKGIIKAGDATIIAISGIALPTYPYRHSGRNPPEIVQSVYAVSNLILVLDRLTGAVTNRYLEQRDQLKNANDSVVATDIFLSDEYSHISAILFDDSDWVNYPDPPGANAKLVHNATAKVPLPHGWFPAGDEYWWRDGAVESYHH